MRIVSLAPSNTEILFEIGIGDQIVATTSLCDYPPRARKLPSVGGWSEGLDIEKVREIEPDLALASDDLQDEVVESLEERSVNVVQLKPHTLEEVFESMERVGKKVRREEEAGKLVEEMKAGLDRISLDGERIYCEEWMEPPMVSGNWVPGLVERIGGSYFIEEGGRSRDFNLEELKGFDPEHIFLNVCGAGVNASREDVLGREGWQHITAIHEENIHVIDDALLNRPGPRLVEGVRQISERI